MEFIINNFDGVSKSPGFEQLARTDVELVIEILKARKWIQTIVLAHSVILNPQYL